MLLGILLTSNVMMRGLLRAIVFFPVLVSTIGVGITFTMLMHPTNGLINDVIAVFGIKGTGLADRPALRPSLSRLRRRLERAWG